MAGNRPGRDYCSSTKRRRCSGAPPVNCRQNFNAT